MTRSHRQDHATQCPPGRTHGSPRRPRTVRFSDSEWTLAEPDRRRQLPGNLVPKLRRGLTVLDEARNPGDHRLVLIDAPQWSIRVSGASRVVFRARS